MPKTPGSGNKRTYAKALTDGRRSDSKIPPEAEPDILRLVAERVPLREISAWLKKHRGVDVSHVCVLRYLKRNRIERSEVAKDVVRAAIVPHLTTDLERLNESLEEIRQRKRGAEDRDLAALISAEVRVVDLKTKLAGAQEQDPPLTEREMVSEIEEFLRERPELRKRLLEGST